MAIPATVHNTLGCMFITAILTAILYGVGILQAGLYFRKYNGRDYVGLRLLIAFILLCDTVQQGAIAAQAYMYVITYHDIPWMQVLTRILHAIAFIILLTTGLIGVSVQQFYCYRIYLVSDRNIFIAGGISLLSCACFIMNTTYAGKLLTFTTLEDTTKMKGVTTALGAMVAATDLAISVSLVWFLHRKKTGFRKSTDMINRLIIFTFNSCIITSLISLVDIIALHAIPNTLVYMVLFPIRDRFYTISMLVTLNSRDYIRGYTSHPSQLHESIPIGRMSKTTTQTTRRDLEHPVDSNPEHSGGLVIKIETTTTNYSEVDQTNYQFDTKR